MGNKISEKFVLKNQSSFYINAFGELAKDSNTVILPANLSEPGSFITQALSIFDQLKSVSNKKLSKESSMTKQTSASE